MASESDVVDTNTLSCANCGKPANLQFIFSSLTSKAVSFGNMKFWDLGLLELCEFFNGNQFVRLLWCPKCVELKLPREGSSFCTQECFKFSWSSHKSLHLKAKLSSSLGTVALGHQNSVSLGEDWLYCLKGGRARTPKFPHFDWTGTLRPYPISSKRIVPAHIDKPDWADGGTPIVEPNSDFQRVVEVDQISRSNSENERNLSDLSGIGSQTATEEEMGACGLAGKKSEKRDAHMLHRWVEAVSNPSSVIAREVLDAAARIIEPGVTTDEIDRVVHEATIAAGAKMILIVICIADHGFHIKLRFKSHDLRDPNYTGKVPPFSSCRWHLTIKLVTGGYPSPLNYHFFPKSCCTSVNEVICHGIPDARKLEDGDIVNVDVTVYYKGVHGDLNETYFVGNVDEESRQLVKCTYECLEKAISIVKPGVRFREIGDIINRHASMSGFSVVKSYCGHGIGELFHCAPNIPHYGRNKAVGVMKAGQTFTIEPMINAGVWRDRMWPDGWTAVTADGKRSAQFEHTLLVTETGVEVLSGRLPTSPNVFPWLNSS
ncbi:hypothetical protein TanjilG_10018 [Lupinus angustifolius]|uniref:Methionine aminopeptidase n=1 Tax=Lupinus angustifolius TaxID=3871 RepID=A0A1J7GKI8_LUPAN|nr:hypothetical protein TanjilG_10018 [Lupinus angustifolius]